MTERSKAEKPHKIRACNVSQGENRCRINREFSQVGTIGFLSQTIGFLSQARTASKAEPLETTEGEADREPEHRSRAGKLILKRL